MKNNKSGLTIWEIALFTIMLAVAGGTSVFFFFLNSEDMKIAQKKYDWIKNVNTILDAVSLEIANCVSIEHPFISDSSNCSFHSALNSGTQAPSSMLEGFSFVNNSLMYVKKDKNKLSKRADFNGLKNPLISGCLKGKFARIGPAKLMISFSMNEPDGSGNVKQFSRIVYLRNK